MASQKRRLSLSKYRIKALLQNERVVHPPKARDTWLKISLDQRAQQVRGIARSATAGIVRRFVDADGPTTGLAVSLQG